MTPQGAAPVLAVDIGGTKVLAALVTPAGELRHAGVFAIMTALWWWTFRITSPHNRALTIAVIAVLSIGAVTEGLQSFVPDRNPSLDDFAINWLITIATALVIHTRLRPHYRSSPPTT